LKFESDQERFNLLLKKIRGFVSKSLTPRIEPQEKAYTLLAATSFIRLMTSYAEGINILLKSEEIEAIAPVRRAIYELWLDLRYLLRSQCPEEFAKKIQINTLFELQAWLDTRDKHELASVIESTKHAIKMFSDEFPGLVKEVEQQRATHRFHWSGLSRTAIERKIDPESTLYKVLSWEAHAIMTVPRDHSISQTNDGTTTLSFGPKITLEREPESIAYSVGEMIYFAWNEFTEYFDLPEIEVSFE
jgi:hypothetical protein